MHTEQFHTIYSAMVMATARIMTNGWHRNGRPAEGGPISAEFYQGYLKSISDMSHEWGDILHSLVGEMIGEGS